MQPDEIRAIIVRFIRLLEVGEDSPQANAKVLQLVLDELALAYHFASAELDCEADAPSEDYARLRQLTAARFPGFGFYTVSGNLNEDAGASQLMVGDALDDIVDIARDLHEVLWYWDNHCEGTALWQFRWGYENHWGEHLRGLQRYLYDLLYRGDIPGP